MLAACYGSGVPKLFHDMAPQTTLALGQGPPLSKPAEKYYKMCIEASAFRILFSVLFTTQ